MTADEEDNYVVAQANARLNDDGSFVDDSIVARFRGENTVVPKDRVDYMDVSPKQVVVVFFISCQVIDSRRYFSSLRVNAAIRRFDEAETVHFRE